MKSLSLDLIIHDDLANSACISFRLQSSNPMGWFKLPLAAAGGGGFVGAKPEIAGKDIKTGLQSNLSLQFSSTSANGSASSVAAQLCDCEYALNRLCCFGGEWVVWW